MKHNLYYLELVNWKIKLIVVIYKQILHNKLKVNWNK